MEISRILFTNKLVWICVFLLTNGLFEIVAQGNCLQYPENSGERKACELSYSSKDYRQGSRESQMLLDSIIALGPNYAWAYYQKSVAYLKRGFLSEGIQILNKAIAIDPQTYLCYRAYWYYSHKSYRSCIRDLELYYSSYGGYVEFTPGGEHEMRMLLGASYAAIGNLNKAIQVISDYLSNPKNDMHHRAEDYYVLGVLHYRNGQYEEAAKILAKQIDITPEFADAYYYLGLVREAQSNKSSAKQAFEQAHSRLEGVAGGYSKRVLGIPSNKNELPTKLAENG